MERFACWRNRRFRSTTGSTFGFTVETGTTPDDVLALAGQVYAGLSDEEVDDVERIALDRRSFLDRTA